MITRHSRPAAVMLSLDDLESLEETLDVLSSPALLSEIREAISDRDAVRGLSHDEAIRLATDR